MVAYGILRKRVPCHAEPQRSISWSLSQRNRLQWVTALNEYYIYIMSNVSRTLCLGVTNDLQRRVYQHKQKLSSGFTRKYNLTLLVYFEATPDILAAIAREKQIKGWLRAKKVSLIESANPKWLDLSAQWQQPGDAEPQRSMT